MHQTGYWKSRSAFFYCFFSFFTPLPLLAFPLCSPVLLSPEFPRDTCESTANSWIPFLSMLRDGSVPYIGEMNKNSDPSDSCFMVFHISVRFIGFFSFFLFPLLETFTALSVVEVQNQAFNVQYALLLKMFKPLYAWNSYKLKLSKFVFFCKTTLLFKCLGLVGLFFCLFFEVYTLHGGIWSKIQ